MNASARAEIVRLLGERIRQLEAGRHGEVVENEEHIPFKEKGLCGLFPRGRIPFGATVDLLASAGAGSWTVGLTLAKQACGPDKILLVADPAGTFYPPAALKLNVDPARLAIARCANVRDLMSILVQALRCPAVGAVVGAFERIDDRESRRLQLAAEEGGGVGVLLRPPTARNQPSFAKVRLALAPAPAQGERHRRVRVQVLRSRGEHDGRSLFLEIDDATGDVRLLPGLASATASPATARGAG